MVKVITKASSPKKKKKLCNKTEKFMRRRGETKCELVIDYDDTDFIT